MKALSRMLVGSLLFLLCSCADTITPTTVKIVALNDFHGNFRSPGKLAEVVGQPVEIVGGVDYLAAYVAERISQNANHVVVGAGDLVGASPLISSAYHDEGTIEAMNLLGLDFSSVGNHEFDAGSAELRRKQHGGCFVPPTRTCLEQGKFSGAKFQYLAANVIDDKTGRSLFPSYEIRAFGNLRVAFVGLVLAGTPSIVLPSGVAGLTFRDEAQTVSQLIPELREKHVNSVVVLVHQGASIDSAPGTGINDCKGVVDSPGAVAIQKIVAGLPDEVDLVISAHSHVAYNCQMKNSVGRLLPVTQASAFGRALTDVDLSFNPTTGRAEKVVAKNILVSQPAADAATSAVHPFLSSPSVVAIRALIADYEKAVAPVANQVVGSIARALPSNPDPSGEELAGDLVADSQLSATSAEGAVMSFINGSGVRNPGFNTPNATYPHDVTYQEAFTARPFGNSLVAMTLTAQQIKDALEQQFTGCSGQTSDNILQVSKGLHVEWSASAAPCHKIANVTLTTDGAVSPEKIVSNYVVDQPQKTYRISMDNYLAAGKSNFTVFLQGTNQTGGPLDIDAVVSYLSSTTLAPKPPFDPADPALGIPRIKKLE